MEKKAKVMESKWFLPTLTAFWIVVFLIVFVVI